MARQLKINNEKGSVMNVALLVLLVLSLIGFSLSKISAIDTKIAGNEKLERIAFYAAEAGLERAMQLLEEGGLSDADWFGTKVAFGDAFYKVDVLDFNGSVGTPPVDPPPDTGTTPPATGSSGSTGGSTASTGSTVSTGSSGSWSMAGGLEDDFDDLDFYDGMGSTDSSSSTGSTASTGSTGGATSAPFSSTASFGSTSGMFEDDIFEFFENESTNDDDLLLIRATGYMNDVERSIEVVFERKAYAHLLKLDGAVATYGDPVEVEGNIGFWAGLANKINGEDHALPVTEDCFSCTGAPVVGTHDTIPGVYTDLTAPKLTQMNTTNNIKGNLPIQTTGSFNTIEGWETIVKDLTQDGAVDNRLNGDGSSSTSEAQTLGTRDEPEITYIEGGDFTFDADVTGNGILIADNGLIFNDNVHYEGLIIIRNLDASDAENELELGVVNGRIFGAVVISGTSAADIQIHNRGKIRYSKEALKNIQELLTGVIPRVVTWREY